MRPHATPVVSALLFALLCSGCLLVRTTEHRVSLSENGGGEALLRLIDIRSDADTDSGRSLDYEELADILEDSTLRGFVTPDRRVTGKRAFLQGDTLFVEVTYAFDNPEAVEGLALHRGEFSVTVAAHRELVHTNGSVETLRDGSHRIIWKGDVRLLRYAVTESAADPGVSLAPWHRAAAR